MAQAGRMQPDASFAEFVSVRWSVLYRLAVLLAGPDEADDLLEGALAGALHSWGELRHAGSAEEHVKERLAHDAAVLAPARGTLDVITVDAIVEGVHFDWRFVALSHNTVRGAAGGAVLTAELLASQGYLTAK